jgi:hypothetical protein
MSGPESRFDSALAYDDDAHVRIKSTCIGCGSFMLVSVLDGTLKQWESQHTCWYAKPQQGLRIGFSNRN